MVCTKIFKNSWTFFFKDQNVWERHRCGKINILIDLELQLRFLQARHDKLLLFMLGSVNETVLSS